MPLDPYISCPCGSGKKFKWCCAAYYAQIEKAFDLDRTGQHEAALHAMQQLTQSQALADYFEAAVGAGAPAKAASNWIMGELARKLKDGGGDPAAGPVPPVRLAELLGLIEAGRISGSTAKGVFEKMFASGRSAGEIVAAEGLTQIDDESEIAALISGVLARNADAVAQYRGGKTATFGYLVGQVMKAAAGRANPRRVNERLREMLDQERNG